jgi:NTP pyrophosphatase (non-canonical NTP hydrolase)
MSINGHDQPNVRLAFLERQALDDSERWFGDIPASQTLAHHLMSLFGEVGELANVYKKIERGSLDPKNPAVIAKLRMETTDIFVYLLNVAALLNFDLDAMNQTVRAQNEKRFTEERRQREAARVNT